MKSHSMRSCFKKKNVSNSMKSEYQTHHTTPQAQKPRKENKAAEGKKLTESS